MTGFGGRMSDLSEWLASLERALADALAATIAHLPYLIAALGLLALGWIVARMVRGGAFRLGAAVNRFLERVWRRRSGVAPPRLAPPVLAVAGSVLFWLVILFFVAMAARVGRLDVVSSWLDRLVAYLPTLVAGGVIVLAGYLVSTLVRDVAAVAASSAGTAQAQLVGLVAQAVVLLTAIVIGLAQIGIDVTFLIVLLGIMVGGACLSLALAFGFGARVFVSNLIAARQVQQLLAPGQTAQIGELEGEVLEITPTSVVLLTSRGRFAVPAKLFQEQAMLILASQDDV